MPSQGKSIQPYLNFCPLLLHLPFHKVSYWWGGAFRKKISKSHRLQGHVIAGLTCKGKNCDFIQH